MMLINCDRYGRSEKDRNSIQRSFLGNEWNLIRNSASEAAERLRHPAEGDNIRVPPGSVKY